MTDRLRVSPAARAAAEAQGIDLASLTGSGPNGRIVLRDLDTAAPDISRDQSVREHSTEPPHRAETMASIWYDPDWERDRRVLHATRVIDATALMAARADLIAAYGASGPRPGLTCLLLRAAALAERALWEVDENFDEGVGLAIARPDSYARNLFLGPLDRPLRRFAEEITRLRTDPGADVPERPMVIDGGGPYFRIANLGVLGLDNFVSARPDSYGRTLEIGRLRDTVTLDAVGRPVKRIELPLTLTWEAKENDILEPSRILAALADALEHPIRLLA
ncbi:E3 binding domain-containing protein [Litorisediminicola beolgyonensis]|uniref:E3 binding domain-containing protein n=1 Tax=Litorisediminicola beolgyonensis TaxID=1173614 RepID=A0ABW3ZPD0_9RHOB